MKAIRFLLAAAFWLAVATVSVSAQTTYTWTESVSNDFQIAGNWTPARNVLNPADVLVFSGAFTPTATVTNIPTQTIGEMHAQGNVTANLSAAATATLTVTGGASAIDLEVASGSSLNIGGANALTISLGTSANGIISGSMTYSGGGHRLLGAVANAITFNNGSSFTADTGFSGSYTSGINGSIVFANGSTYISKAGSNPLAGSVTTFQTGSLYSHQQSGAPSASGRTYANFEYKTASSNNITGGSAFVVDNLTITQGTLNYNMTGTPGHSIKGNISVAGGATLNFAPATTLTPTLNLNGTSTQTISGAGTITINDADQIIVINNSSGITLARDLTLDLGTLTFTSGNITTGVNTLIIGSGETVNHTSGHVIGNLRKTYAAAATKSFEVGTANGFSPVTVSLAGSFPTDFTVSAVQSAQPNILNPTHALQRYWKLTGTGVTATLIFNYLDPPDVPVTANENTFVIFKYDGAFSMPGGTVNPATNQATIAGATGFSDWTLAEPNAPTAADASVNGRILDTDGIPISGVGIRLGGTQNRLTVTDAFGNYHFDNVETNGFYTVTPTRANYRFGPVAQSFSALGNRISVAFTGSYTGERANPLDTPEYFVRQQYLDFLGREPEEAGLTGWVNTINNCAAGDTSCDRVHVSESFFRSAEFEQRGYFLYRFYSTALGRKPDYSEFAPDFARVSGFLDDPQLETAKTAFVNSFAARPAFTARYNSLNNAEYVNALMSTAGVNLGERQSMIDALNTGAMTRAAVLRQIAESGEVYQKYYNQAFVVMEYFGYLQRDPDALYLNWIVVLDANPADARHMVDGFVNAAEYRNRFVR